ncbi:hypothetical protein ScPMuIL_001112 [Solemya velum]
MYRTVTIIILTLICKSSAGDCDNCINDQCDIKLGLPVCSLGCDPDWRGSSCVVPYYKCEPGWNLYDGSCFQFFDIKKSWHEARSYCQALGNKSDLGIIYNLEMNEYMHLGMKNSYWFGMNDLASEGNFIWLDNKDEEVPFLNWASGEPNSNLGDEDCGGIWANKGPPKDGKWNDFPCYIEIPFVCQYLGVCPDYYYGPECSLACGHCVEFSCHSRSGICDGDVLWDTHHLSVKTFVHHQPVARTGPNCLEMCVSPEYGQNCSSICDTCTAGEGHPGECLQGCNPGWTGPFCNNSCVSPAYGQNCTSNCDTCTAGDCHHETGECLQGCKPGWIGPLCDNLIPWVYGGSIIFSLLIIIWLIHLPLLYWARKKDERLPKGTVFRPDDNHPVDHYQYFVQIIVGSK